MTTTRHLAPLGGLRDAPATTAPDTYMIAALIGGADLDLSGASIPPGGTTITKVSLIGGAHVRVPAGCRVDISALTIIGRRRTTLSHAAPDGPVVRIRAYGLVGGLRVED